MPDALHTATASRSTSSQIAEPIASTGWLPEAEPGAFDHPATGGRRPLLKLPGCGVAAETDFQIGHLLGAKPLAPQQFARLRARIGEAD